MIRGETVASGKLYPNMLLAAGADRSADLQGRPADSPLTGLKAIWVSPGQRADAEHALGEVLSAADVLVRHLGQVIRSHAAELLTRQQVSRMLENLKANAPSLVAEAGERMSVGQIHKVLQSLLREEVPVRDLETVLEALIEASAVSTDVAELTEHVRTRLGRTLSRRLCDDDGKLHCVMLDSQLEESLGGYVGSDAHEPVPAEMAGRLTQALGEALGGMKRRGRRPIVLCSPRVRAPLRRLLQSAVPDAAVLSYSEIDSVEVQTSATIRI
jgi:flagellar biosynthesis protein FlhA